MRIRLPNGLLLEGTHSQIIDSLEKWGLSGDGVFYMSDSKGLVLIAEMQSTHLRNAILKLYKEWLNELYAIGNPKEVVERIVEGIKDKTWIAMVKELSRRDE